MFLPYPLFLDFFKLFLFLYKHIPRILKFLFSSALSFFLKLHQIIHLVSLLFVNAIIKFIVTARSYNPNIHPSMALFICTWNLFLVAFDFFTY